MQTKTTHVEGVEVTRNGEMFFKIENVDGMRPFFMSIVSHSDHWLFISSTGSLTAGRKNANFALFPYYTDDKITESSEHTGSKSIFLVDQGDKTYLWEPFSSRYSGVYSISRNLYKNAYGNKIVFEEINHDLGLEFSYEWNSSEQFGFVRKSQLIILVRLNCMFGCWMAFKTLCLMGFQMAFRGVQATLLTPTRNANWKLSKALAFML